jgi:hypothetical protein
MVSACTSSWCVCLAHALVPDAYAQPTHQFVLHRLSFWNTILYCTLIKKEIKVSSYIRKLRVEQLQSHIWLTASSYMGKYLGISLYIRKPFLIDDFATAPLWISLYMRKIYFLFFSVQYSIVFRKLNLRITNWCVGWAYAYRYSLASI